MAIRSFRNKATEDLNYELNSKRARAQLPVELHEKARVKLARIHAASSLIDLSSLPGNKFEALKGDRIGQYSIRINKRYRICFTWQNGAAFDVEVVDYH